MNTIELILYESCGHHFQFAFAAKYGDKLLRHVARMAADPELDCFNWHDAAIVSARIRKSMSGQEQRQPLPGDLI